MKPTTLPLAAVVLICTSFPGIRTADICGSEPVPSAEVVDSVNAFTFDLYGCLAKQSQDNLFLSPASVSTALTMTYAGARGDTEAQMAAVLHLPDRNVHEGFHAMVEYLNALGEQEKFDLTVANALWAQRKYGFRREFTELLDAHYGAALRRVDYDRDTEAARRTINAWVEEQTNGKIRDLIPRDVLAGGLTHLVLTNAIYFHGHWRNQFEPDNTRPLPFTTAVGNAVETPMMVQEAEFQYAEDDAAQCLEMGYAGGDMTMTILLPRRKDGLSALEKGFSPADLRHWTERLRPRTVKVCLPKFSMTAQFQLEPVLASMGMSDAFAAGRADFSGMDGKKGMLYLHEVVHKGFVDVNETGTEATGATGAIVDLRGRPSPEFRADHPFLFLIRDTRTGAVLFLGRFNEPEP